MTLVEELRRQLDEERRDNARWRNAHYVLTLENEQLRVALGKVNGHPAHIAHVLRALADKLDMQHMDCKPG